MIEQKILDEIKIIHKRIEEGTASQIDKVKLLKWVKYNRIASFKAYMKYMVPNPGDGEWMWYQEYIMDEVQKAIELGRENIIIEMPPQSGKTLICGSGLISYIFGRFPEKQIIYATYNEEKAKDAIQNLILPMIMSEKFEALFESRVKWNVEEELDCKSKKKKQATSLAFSNVYSNRGGVRAAGRRTMLTGKPADILIIDDYFKDDSEAFSVKVREQVWNWYATTARTRQQAKTIKIVFATRWHSDDLIGRILEKSKNNKDPNFIPWKVITFRAEKMPEDMANLYDKRKVGEPLDPNKLHLYAENKDDYRVWMALFQQTPLNELGHIFQRDRISYYRTLPENINKILISVDTNCNSKSKHGDEGAVHVWGKYGNYYYLLKFVSKRFDYVELKNTLHDIIKEYPNYWAIIIEARTNGHALVSDLKNAGFSRVIDFEPGSSSKLTRASLILPYFDANEVMFPDPKINSSIEKIIGQLLNFTGEDGASDDNVDALVMALLYYKAKDIVIQGRSAIKSLPNSYSKLFGRKEVKVGLPFMNKVA